MKKYFIDTSIWIDYLNDKNKDLNDKIDDLIEENCVCINGIVLSELLHGANNEVEFNQLSNYLNGLIYIDLDKNTFEKVVLNCYTKGNEEKWNSSAIK